jgi:hypothetical protein
MSVGRLQAKETTKSPELASKTSNSESANDNTSAREQSAELQNEKNTVEDKLSEQETKKSTTKTYPTNVVIGTETVHVASKEEEEEATKILKAIKDDYGIDVNSGKGVQAIKDQYTKVPKEVTDKLVSMEWEFKELKALKEALDCFAPILGANREKSNLKGTDQEITSVSKVKQAIDTNSGAGQLDTSTLGEFFKGGKNFSMFKAGTNSTVDFTDNAKQLKGTAIHEIGHGLFASKYDDWVSKLPYWKDVSTKSGKVGAEEPITKYGQKNAREDLCEALMYFFVEKDTLKTKCPERHKLLTEYIAEWTPKEEPAKGTGTGK